MPPGNETVPIAPGIDVMYDKYKDPFLIGHVRDELGRKLRDFSFAADPRPPACRALV